MPCPFCPRKAPFSLPFGSIQFLTGALNRSLLRSGTFSVTQPPASCSVSLGLSTGLQVTSVPSGANPCCHSSIHRTPFCPPWWLLDILTCSNIPSIRKLHHLSSNASKKPSSCPHPLMQRPAWVTETSQLPSPEGIFLLQENADSCIVLQMFPLLAGASTLPCSSLFSHCLAPFLPTPSWLQFSRLHLWPFYLTQDTFSLNSCHPDPRLCFLGQVSSLPLVNSS